MKIVNDFHFHTFPLIVSARLSYGKQDFAEAMSVAQIVVGAWLYVAEGEVGGAENLSRVSGLRNLTKKPRLLPRRMLK